MATNSWYDPISKKVKVESGEAFIPIDKIDELLKEVADQSANQHPNLLEIKLKDTDSVPEVWYRGERLDSEPKGLVDVFCHWHTSTSRDNGKSLVSVKYLDGNEELEHSHHRLC